MSKLPSALWTRREDLAKLVSVLGVENIRWVGGAVRDTLLGAEVRDIDAATSLLPEEVMRRLKAADITPVPTGIEHGTVTAVLPDGNVEITTLRKDVATDGRRATVAFASEWQEDAARRDFTINALYAHPETLEISDFFGGLADLDARRVRFIGEAKQRIAEDHLRILRYYRFQARFGSALDDEAEEACAKMAATLKGLSRERVAAELLNLLGLPKPLATLQRMFERSVLPVVLPETGEDEMRALIALIEAEERFSAAPSALRRFSALLPTEAKLARSVASRLRLSNNQKKTLSRYADRSFAELEWQELAYRNGGEMARDMLLLTGRDPSPLADWDIPNFPLKGGQIIERGVEAGPQVAKLLRAVESRWIAEHFPDEARVFAILEEEIAP